MNRKSLLSLVLAGSLAIGGAVGSYAWFTSNATSTANTFHAGTIKVDVNNSNGNEDNHFAIPFKSGLIQPSDVITTGENGYSTITVKNNGTLPMATFGRFTLANDDGLAKDIKITDYKVDFYNADKTKKSRVDNFIENGVDKVGGFNLDLKGWVDKNGPQDIPGTAWDEEALKPGEYFTITFKLVYDANAVDQDKKCDLGYEVKTTQVNADAITNLGLEGVGADYVRAYVFPYLADQVK